MLRSAARPCSLLLAVLLLGPASVGMGSGEAFDDPTDGLLRAAARPAPAPYPRPPGVERPADEQPPRPVALAPDAAEVGRMPEGGTVARFDFVAEEGALSLFEMTAWGYARGWTSSARMVVRGAGGEELARTERSGGTVYTDVLPFVAPADGAYALEVSTVESGFRYLVVRHAGYPARGTGVTFATSRDDTAVHEWIGDEEDRVAFRVLGEPGERIVLRAEPTNGRGRNQKRAVRRRISSAIAAGGGGGGDFARAKERLGPRARDDDSFPDLALEVEPGGARVAGRGQVAVVRVPDAGWLDVEVRRTNGGSAGLFDLAIERDVPFTSVRVRAGDEDDDPLAGVRVALFQEPGMDLVGEGTTGEDGTLVLDVPVGDYTVVHRAEDAAAASVRTRIEGGELNLVVTPG
ncbi:MAG: prealbumin-like fold domain-containing protein [Planctomycetota bacterium]